MIHNKIILAPFNYEAASNFSTVTYIMRPYRVA